MPGRVWLPCSEGLPSGGLMDYTFYREIIPDALWVGQEPPADFEQQLMTLGY